MSCAAHPFAPPPGPAARGCLAALAVAGALLLATAGLGGLVASTYAVAHAARPSRPALQRGPAAGRPADLAAARRAWGEIRARYRLKDLVVPA